MDLFFYIAIIGATMILFSKVQHKKICDRARYNGNELILNKTKQNNFFIKIKNSFLYELFYSQEFAKMNGRYGRLMVIIGIVGMLVFKTLAIILVCLILIILFFYMFQFVKRLIKSIRSY
ncbi:hypothetical protein [Intestinibacter sp.]|uniref:hypothetical protein n=1 Tax=Intestinibacter sp. TaxID=1965304 RepID=UPI002A91F5E5|nr:hypothetical protein [Intestinibacter sp.]MDY5211865.1 hypothetical protein [Intestinibacter sp.]